MSNVFDINYQKLDRLAAEGTAVLSSDERWRQILGMMEFAVRVMSDSPDADRIRAYKDSQEMDWQRIQQRLFSHASRI